MPDMTAKIIPIRREVLPERIFSMVERYMMGELSAIHIIGVTADGRVINASAGDIPQFIKQNDAEYGS